MADAIERHPKQIHVRMSEGEVARAKVLAKSLGVTLSDLIRTLLQLPASSIEEGGGLVVVDRVTALKLSREMRRWGHHYNQAVHALNAIAKRAVEVGDLSELARPSDAVTLIEASRARCLGDLDALSREKDDTASRTVTYVRAKGLLPEERPAIQAHRPQVGRPTTGGNRGSASTTTRPPTPTRARWGRRAFPLPVDAADGVSS